MSTEEHELADIEAWFARKGFGFLYEEDGGLTWAHLTSARDGSVFWPKYGRGDTRIEAARSAKHRYETEQ